MVFTYRSVALSVAIAAASTAQIQAAPLQYNPYTPINTNFPLTASHPAYGGKLKDDCVEPVIPKDPNQAKAESMVVTGSMYRKLRGMEDASNTDVAKLENYFGTSMELDFNTLKEKYGAASAPSSPWASSYWPTFQDSINSVWKAGEPSASEKYANAFGLDPTDFKNKVSANNGIDAHKNRKACSTNSDCASTNDGSECAIRDGTSSGYCIPTWWGICHAWAPAAILEQEPQCSVEKNGVTFHVFDIKALLTDLYDGASLKTVFTGARFNGPDSPANADQYGRYVNAARRDLGAGYFHIAIANIMGKQHQSFVVDVSAGAEVWNQPVRSYEVQTMELVDVAEASQQFFGISTYPFNAEMAHLAYVKTTLSWISEAYEDGPLVSTGEVDRYTSSQDYEYLLELDANYAVIGGEWVGRSKEDHPDFLWFPTGKPAASAVTSAGLSYANVEELLELSLTCNSPTEAPTETPTMTPTEIPSTVTPSSSLSGSDGHEETPQPTSVPSESGSSGINGPITIAPAAGSDAVEPTSVPSESGSTGTFIPITTIPDAGNGTPKAGLPDLSDLSKGIALGKPTSTPETPVAPPNGKPIPPPQTPEIPIYPSTLPPSSTPETPVAPPEGKPTLPPQTPLTPEIPTYPPISTPKTPEIPILPPNEMPMAPPNGKPIPPPQISQVPEVPEVTPIPSTPTSDYPVPPSTPEALPTPAPTWTEQWNPPAPTEPTEHFMC